jgi:uncharacterized protein (TIGR02145 family)/uncharacterized repeat protein (TIGR02543 family)
MRTFTLVLALMLSGLLLQSQSGSPCPGEPTVTYDGKTYNTILVGDRCWLKENLNVGTMILSGQDQKNNGIIEKYCYGDLPANCETYGGLYQWHEAMQYEDNSGAQGICPSGWRVATDDDWKMLEGVLDSNFDYGDAEWDGMNFRGFDAGKNMKATTGWVHNGNGTDLYGVAVLPGGHRDFCRTFYSKGHTSYLWTATSFDEDAVWYRIVTSGYSKISRRHAHQNLAASVRCVKDYAPQSYNLILEVYPADAGTLTGEGQYLAGEEINITAEANTGWEFVNWTDDNGIVSETPDFTYTMPAADITLTANFVEEQVGFTCGTSTVTDVDGNVYNTVLIGDQCWVKENLKTTKYHSGTPIEYPGTDNGAWGNNTTGAYAWYDNDISWKDSYGALYNWHAVNNADGLCPAGWHVASDTELTQLVDYVVAQGYPNVWNIPNGAGNALKSCRQVNSPYGWDCNTTEHPRWDSHNTHNGFDAFGFSGLPGGLRNNTGGFQNIGSSFRLWSSTESSTTHAHIRDLSLFSNLVSRTTNFKSIGVPVRCIKTPPTYNLNLDVNPAGAGTVTGAGQYQAGQQVNITAAANLGWAFVNWTDDDGIVSEAPNFTYTMPASDVTLTANFVTTTTHNLNLDVNPAGAGTVTGAGLYNSGQQVNISALANTGWEFVNWTDDDVIVNELAVFTYTIPTADVTLTANFVEEQANFTCGTSTVTDVDGYVYNTLLIGDQCWMDKNLSTTRFRDGSTIDQAWVYDPTLVEGINSAEEMVAAYGRLYSWHEANDAKGICPAGWTVPAQSEFQQLVDYVIDTYEDVTADNASYAFKSCRQVDSPLGGDCNTTTHPRWDQTTQHGFDLVDFSALPAGRFQFGSFSGIGTQLFFWSSTEHNAANGVFARIMNGVDGVTITNMDKNRGVSLRCIRE